MIFSASGRPGSSKARLAGWWDGARHIEPDGCSEALTGACNQKSSKSISKRRVGSVLMSIAGLPMTWRKTLPNSVVSLGRHGSHLVKF
jgi:hypothetical protein